VPRPLPTARRRGEARRLASGRISGRDAGVDAVRAVPEADDDALSQPAGDGDRGVASFVSGGRSRAVGRLRQDDAGASDGRDQHEPARAVPAGRTYAARRLARPGARFRIRRLEILGGETRRQPVRSRVAGDRKRHRALAGPLHDDGHCLDDDLRRRGARDDACGRGVHPRRATSSRLRVSTMRSRRCWRSAGRRMRSCT